MRHNTGRLPDGLNGTVVSAPHSVHFTRVSALVRPPHFAALHRLHRFGSLENPFSLKNCCSAAENRKAAPQSAHLISRSTNSISAVQWGSSVTRSLDLSNDPGQMARCVLVLEFYQYEWLRDVRRLLCRIKPRNPQSMYIPICRAARRSESVTLPSKVFSSLCF